MNHPIPIPPPTPTVVSVPTNGLPDAWVNGDTIQLAVTQPLSGTQARLVIPLADAAAWAAEVYVAVTVAYRNATGDDIPVAPVAHSGRVITGRLTPPAAAGQETPDGEEHVPPRGEDPPGGDVGSSFFS